jgi:hypothetical protein
MSIKFPKGEFPYFPRGRIYSHNAMLIEAKSLSYIKYFIVQNGKHYALWLPVTNTTF